MPGAGAGATGTTTAPRGMATGPCATAIQGAGWKPQPPAVIARANNNKMERVTRIRAIRPSSFELTRLIPW
jgi:hypothetical protein